MFIGSAAAAILRKRTGEARRGGAYMTGVLWALFGGCAIAVVTLMLAGLRKRLVDRFSEAQVSYFFHVVGLWAVFLFLMWLGWEALSHPRDADLRAVLGLYVIATSIGAVVFLDWLWKQKW